MGHLKLRGTLRGVAPQGHDVAETAGVNAIREVREFGSTVTDAGEVRHRFDPVPVADPRDDLNRLVAGRAAGSVGHRNESRLKRS